MYNAGRQYGLGSARQRNIRDRTKSIMGRYAEKIDSFCERFGYDPDMKFIKGEEFDEQVERVD